jgi:PAS domain S-box-containing protein
VSLREELRIANLRFELAGKTEGLWDMQYPADGQLLPTTPFLWSERFRELLGFSSENEFPNLLDSWGSRLHPNDKDQTFAAFSAHLVDRSGRTPYDIEYQLKMRSGEYRWFLARGYTQRDAAGNPLRVNGSLRDITAQKVLDQKLRASRENLQSAISDVRERMNSLLNLAVENTETTNNKMKGLDIHSKEVRTFSDAIGKIARTSNMLALNAMIEAARCGEQGKGFTVVAEQVKRLATATAEATTDIQSEADCIAGEIAEVSEAISHFGGIVEQMRAIQETLTSTIEAETAF